MARICNLLVLRSSLVTSACFFLTNMLKTLNTRILGILYDMKYILDVLYGIWFPRTLHCTGCNKTLNAISGLVILFLYQTTFCRESFKFQFTHVCLRVKIYRIHM